MKEKINDLIEAIKFEIGELFSLKWVEIMSMLLYILVFIGIVIVAIIGFLLSLLFATLLLPFNLLKKILKKRIWWVNLTTWFRVYLEYKWDCMPYYKIYKVREYRKNGYKNLSQKTLNRWAYWIYRDYRERKFKVK